jgi:hypothetical protein
MKNAKNEPKKLEKPEQNEHSTDQGTKPGLGVPLRPGGVGKVGWHVPVGGGQELPPRISL